MNRWSRIVTVTLLVAAAAAVVIAVLKAREIDEVSTQAADDIEAQLDALDPVTRAAVVAKLSSDAVNEVRAANS
jgi:hypothetical protein